MFLGVLEVNSERPNRENSRDVDRKLVIYVHKFQFFPFLGLRIDDIRQK